MAKKINFSPTLKKIWGLVEGFKEKCGTEQRSVLHALLAVLELHFSNSEADSVEVRECVDMIGFKDAKLIEFAALIGDHLLKNKSVSTEENLSGCETRAVIKGDVVDEQETFFFTAPMLMAEILEDRSGVIAQLKEKIAPADETAENTSENAGEAMQPLDDLLKDYDFDLFTDEDFDDVFDDEPEQIETISSLVAETNRLQSYLLERVFGQDEAISALVSGYFNGVIKNGAARKDSRPAATFLFAGAPGVGKTFLAECAAKQLGRPFKRFDMSGFSDKEATLSFSGSNKVFRNAHAGLVTEFVEQNPNAVLLFDEIEKAHKTVIHLFLQMLDAGHVKDLFTERDVSFKDTIIIMTTNVGRALYENDDEQFSKTAVSRKVIINALATEKDPQTDAPYFPTAICSRFASGNILLFNPLSAPDLIHIAERRLLEFCHMFETDKEVEIHFDKHIGPALLFSEGSKVDARSLKGRADAFISSEVFKWLKFAHARNAESLDGLLGISIEVDVENGGEAAWLFNEEETNNVLLFSERENIFERVLKCDGYNFYTTSDPEEAKEIVARNEIDFVICDIIRDHEKDILNIEDTSSAGRKLFDFFAREEIPFYVYTEHELQINVEERQALLAQKAHGFFENYVRTDTQEFLADVAYQISCEKKLLRLGRANKVLTFDCDYAWEDDELGVIRVTNLRVSPAIDAEDKRDIAPTDVSNITFDQIIGAEDVKEELRSFISFLRNPREYARYGIPAPKGIMLYGPPGTGKTMLAKALAQEAGTAFIATEGNMFLKSTYGQASESIHNIFRKARKYAPCILFIDEIDVIAHDRMSGGGSPTANEALNALLNEMDGFSTNPNKPVFVLAATNFDVSFGRKSALDPAVLRRFDRRIFVDLPDQNERKRFMRERLARSRQTLDEVSLDNFAARTVAMSLAEISLVVDFALRSMLRQGESALTNELLNEALETFCYGEAREKNEDVAKRVAIHEAGHAFISWHYGVKPSYITISSRGSFGGYMRPETQNSMIMTAKDLKAKICTSLAGRAAEVVFYGEEDGISTGASSDLRHATDVALGMITELGMSEEHGLMANPTNAPDAGTVKLCNQILEQQFDIAVDLIRRNMNKITRLADTLVEKNHLIGTEVDAIFKSTPETDNIEE